METKKCIVCEKDEPLSNYLHYKLKDKSYVKSYCKNCTNKDRCHTCKMIRPRERFFINKGRVNNAKCKVCYTTEYKKIQRETPLF
jgi:hypothetical protein